MPNKNFPYTEKQCRALDEVLDRIRRKKPKNSDDIVHRAHDEVFSEFDCLACANCCKTTGPLFTDKDIERISKFLKMKPSAFEAQYLRVDEDQDKVLQTVPCAFLDAENYCLIYEVRPKACREYPHTDRKNFHQIAGLTKKNIRICPAAYQIIERVKSRLP